MIGGKGNDRRQLVSGIVSSIVPLDQVYDVRSRVAGELVVAGRNILVESCCDCDCSTSTHEVTKRSDASHLGRCQRLRYGSMPVLRNVKVESDANLSSSVRVQGSLLGIALLACSILPMIYSVRRRPPKAYVPD